MFNPAFIVKQLEKNREVFEDMLTGLSKEEYIWKPLPEKWCLLEVICHLYDEEREDFRARLKNVLDSNTNPLPSIDPQGWVSSRKYAEKNFEEMLSKFLKERTDSVNWLESLNSPAWDNAYHHPKFGPMSGKLFLSNWLAHDYHHIRQILYLKYGYLKTQTTESLDYAGTW